jgi:tetratricopeptide (TPR) repeat protein
MALTYIVQRENDKALEYLLKAEKLAPKDVVVINNIAEIYGRIGNYPQAREYYGKMIQHGNEQDKAYAREKMERMK